MTASSSAPAVTFVGGRSSDLGVFASPLLLLCLMLSGWSSRYCDGPSGLVLIVFGSRVISSLVVSTTAPLSHSPLLSSCFTLSSKFRDENLLTPLPQKRPCCRKTARTLARKMRARHKMPPRSDVPTDRASYFFCIVYSRSNPSTLRCSFCDS